MVIAEFSFNHYGYSGSLSVSDPNLVMKIQKHINLGQRVELFSMLVGLLLGESMKNRVGSSADCTLMELKEFYELNNSTVALSTGAKLQIV